MIIVIDGPSGSGKSTLSKKLSAHFGIPYFDTGAMYRSFCWFLLKNHIASNDENKIEEMLKKMDYKIVTTGDDLRYLVNGEDVTDAIRSEEVSRNVSEVSAYLFVREHLVRLQREFGKSHHAIFEGRDMGTVVFPDADVKFFLFADPNIRALRRFEQLKGKFPLKQFEEKKVFEEIMKRDEYDASRKHSPLKQAKDAILIDVSHLTIDEVFEKMRSTIDERRDGN